MIIHSSLKHIVIVTPRSNDVANPDTHFGILGRALLTHLKAQLGLTDKELTAMQRLCLYGDPSVCRKTYMDCLGQVTGHTPFKPLQRETGSSHDLRQHLRELVAGGVEMLFIITTSPFVWLTTLAEDVATGPLPDELPPMGALLVSANSGSYELKPCFMPA